MLTHGQQHVMSINATAKKDWSAEADMWDPMVKHVYAISDALADGIAKQFPGQDAVNISAANTAHLPSCCSGCKHSGRAFGSTSYGAG
jgi:hypothetical protein